jgi:hypothetical protein
MNLGVTELLVILTLILLLVIGVIVIVRGGRGDDDADVWARRHGLALTAASRPWVDRYLRLGRNLRQIGGFGGLVVAAAVTAATGLDLGVSGLVWVLLGYLAGALWAELALTRLPAGTRRTASLTTRRLADYVPHRMQVMEIAAPVLALALGALATLAYRWRRSWELHQLEVGASGLVVTGAHRTDELLHSGARVAALLAPAIMLVVWLAQRYLVGRPQPMVEPSLVAADDALRSSSTHMLGACGLAATWLLVGGQLGYLFSTAVDRGGPWAALCGVGVIASFVAAYACFRWRNAPWQVRHEPLGGAATPGGTDTTGSSVGAAPGPVGTAEAAPSGAAVLAATGRSEPGPAAFGTTAVAATVGPASGADRPNRADGSVWSLRRSPIPLAITLVVLIGLAGWGLRTWGVINPAVGIYSQGLGLDSRDEATATVQVHNEARAPIEITSIVSTPPADGGALVNPGPPLIESVAVSDVGRRNDPLEATLPLEVPGGTWLQIELTVPEAISCPTGAIETAPFDVEITYRTEWGRTVRESVPVEPEGPIDCVPPLPTGIQPADPSAAEAAVRSAANTVYNPSSGADRLALIDDPTGVADTTARAAAGPYAAQVASTYGIIGEISFDRPDHAWFHYQLSAGFGTRTGEAVLVDGQWRITRDTVCADLALANVTCPPLPR